jgi:hypothetical protein
MVENMLTFSSINKNEQQSKPILYSGIHTFEHTNVEVETCMCGSEPVVVITLLQVKI